MLAYELHPIRGGPFKTTVNMMKTYNTAADILRQITASAGSGYLNRARQRSFSLNVFHMNAVELMEAAQRVTDPEQGLALMLEKNREAGLQAHRELDRRVHNFVSSALSLVAHTRALMRRTYSGTELLATYERQVTATFAESPVVQFVHGLRNYVLHVELPDSSMFLNFTSDPDAADGSGTIETGVHYDTAPLLQWDGWNSIARVYLEQTGEHLDLHEVAQEYVTIVDQFHGWLDAILLAHHQSDLQELSGLQAKLQELGSTEGLSPVATTGMPDSTIVKPFGFTTQHSAELDEFALDLLGKIQELHFRERPQGFPTERPVVTITNSDMIEPITCWGQEDGGASAFMFIHHDGKSYGLSDSDYSGIVGLTDIVMKSPWARSSLSQGFIEKTFIDWARRRIGAGGRHFSEFLTSEAQEKITLIEVWAPIANMEVEQAFEFGPVRIEPITSAAIGHMRSRASSPRPEQEQQGDQLFEKLRNDIQGYAAVVVSMHAERKLAQERGLRVAQDVVGLLSFFSPAAQSFVFNPVALAGAAYIPASKLIMLWDSGFSLTEGVLPRDVGYWRLPSQQISALKAGLMGIAASLVMPEGLSEFALAVRASLLTYTKGTTLVDPRDRLRNCVSAIEGILLRHEMEPRAHSVANRMSCLLAQGGADRDLVKQTVRQVYWMQTQAPSMVRGRLEDELIAVFTSYAHYVLSIALGNVPTVRSRVEFVIGIDRVGLAPQ